MPFGRSDAAALVAALALAVALAQPAAADRGETDIVGGAPTTVAQWPWQVAIAVPPSAGGDGSDRQYCGGSLVAPTAVLTAAHCVFDAGAFQALDTLSVISGRTTLSNGAQGAEIAVTDVIYFVTAGGRPTPQSVTQPALGPQLYNEATSQWDVAIVELGSAAPAPAAPIPIADPSERGLWDQDEPVVATGWGDTTNGGDIYSDDLRAVALTMIGDGDCGDALSYGADFDPATMVCAGSPPAGGKDTCQGDSGGPLVAAAPAGDYRLIGVTSFGEGCALAEKWGVYARVADSVMRQAITEGIALAPGGPGTPTVDRTAPSIELSKRPPKRTRKRRARFSFAASEQSSFSCALDKRAATPCTSPYSKRVGRGRHRLTLTATDAAGNAASVSYRWRVLPR